jgi:hypothetical protein
LREFVAISQLVRDVGCKNAANRQLHGWLNLSIVRIAAF